MEVILREGNYFLGKMIIIQTGIMGNFPAGWEILHDFCGMGVHGFDKMFICLFVSYPTNDNHPLRAQVKWPVHCN
jgi:hypothetical protein